jgi:hypothetical protein
MDPFFVESILLLASPWKKLRFVVLPNSIPTISDSRQAYGSVLDFRQRYGAGREDLGMLKGAKTR